MNDRLLKAFMDKCSTQAETLFDGSADPSEPSMMAHIIAEDINGEIAIYMCPMFNREEELMFRAIPDKLRAEGKWRHWCLFADTWAATYEPNEVAPTPKKHPLRMEVIAFAAENASGERLAATRQIYRCSGQPARLLPLVFYSDRQKFI